MELLLVTPLESDYIIRGKIRGLISFTVPLLAVPAGTVLAHGRQRQPARGQSAGRPVVIAILLPRCSGLTPRWACVVSLQASLKAKGSVQAVIQSIGIMTVWASAWGSVPSEPSKR